MRKDQQDEAVKHAARHGQLEVVKWLSTEYVINSADLWNAVCRAAENDHLEVVKWLCTNHVHAIGPHGLGAVFARASKKGQLSVTQWLSDNATFPDSYRSQETIDNVYNY